MRWTNYKVSFFFEIFSNFEYNSFFFLAQDSGNPASGFNPSTDQAPQTPISVSCIEFHEFRNPNLDSCLFKQNSYDVLFETQIASPSSIASDDIEVCYCCFQ